VVDAPEGAPVGDAVDDISVVDVGGVHEGWPEMERYEGFVFFRWGRF